LRHFHDRQHDAKGPFAVCQGQDAEEQIDRGMAAVARADFKITLTMGS
jgi:hypothetical protein